MHLSLNSNATKIDIDIKCEGRTLSKKAMCNGLIEAQFSVIIHAFVISPNRGYLTKACQLR
jgi:hypothetical protein